MGYNTAAPLDTAEVTNIIDANAPTTILSATPLVAGGSDYLVKWTATDDAAGSGIKHVTVYVAEDGGDFNIWQQQTTETSGVYVGRSGHTYEFLALATDNAGNKEQPSLGISAPNDGSAVNLGTLPTVEKTTQPELGTPPQPQPQPSTNQLFLEAKQGIPSATPTTHASEFNSVLRPFIASSFATGIPNSHANIGPLAIAVLKDGSVLASGGANRGSLYNFSATGGAATTPLTTLQYPIFDLAIDSNGSLWATTGGGPLLQLDAQTGNIVKQYGDSITQAIAFQTGTGLIYVSSGKGIEIFNPINETFTHYSDLRVDSLAFNADGKLWATTWPQRGDIVRFNDLGQPERILKFDSPVDSIAFGKAGSRLAGLLFVDNNNGDLQMVDLATLQHVLVASGGSRGENITTTDDGRVLLSQSHQIDVFNPVIAPKVAATNPAPNAIVALPQGTISVTFDQDMFAGSANDTTSVLNPANFEVVSASGKITPQSVRYDAKTRTVLLDFNTLTPDHYELRVSPNLKSTAGAELTDGYKEQFTAVSDFSALVDFKFTNPRSDRQHQTISYDVILTSKASSDLLLPVMLLLDPAQSFTGVPRSATRNASGAYMVDLKDNLPQGVLKAGQSTTAHTITVYNPDALRVEFTPGIYALPYPNLAPIITSAPVLTAYSGQSYNYQVAANDPDGAVLGYLLYDAPQGMSVDQNTGLISWSPTQQSPVSTDVTLQVYDLRGAHTTQSFTLNVVGGNHKPVFNTPLVSGGTIASTSNLIKGAEGKALQIKVQATDADRNKLTYWADNLPNGAIFDSATGILTWSPNYNAAGTYENVQFTVSDGVETVVQTATILIAPTNQAPTLIRPANTIVREGEKVRIQLQASDADGTTLSYNSNLLPGGSQLDPRTGFFEWTPAYFQAGEFEIPFSVSDGESITTQTTKITVLNVNAAPVFDNLGAWQIQEGQSVSFRAFALDPDNPGFVPQDRNADGQLTILEGSDPSVSYTVSGLPDGATFDPITAMFVWTPGYASAGTYNVTFIATDDGNGTRTTKTTSRQVPITVYNTNRAPQITEFTNITLNRGEVKELVLQATDADGDPLVLQLKTESTGYSIPNFISFTDNGNRTATLRLAPGADDSGNYSFILTASDNGNGDGENAIQSDSYTFVVSVNALNDAPKLPFIGNKVAVVGETLEFLVKASDRNQDNLNFNLSSLPAGATLTPTAIYGEALFSWTPTLADIGTSPVTIRVQDSGNGNSTEVLTSQQAFNLVVRTSNIAPILSAIANSSVAEGQTLTKTLSSSDADGDTLTYSASNLPPGAVLDAAQGILSWTPTLSQARTYNNITVTTSDGNKSSSQTFAILVNNTNQAPVLAPLPIQTGLENNLVGFTLAAGDIDNDSLIYSAVSALPTGAAFDPRTGQFTWKPNYEQAGEYILRFAATDAQGASDIRDVTLRIANVNRSPAISVSTHAVALGERLQFTVAGTDPDNNTNLTYSAVDLPDGAVLNAATGQFTWTPNPGQVGDYGVTYAVSDGEKTVTQTSSVRVAIAPTAPTVTFDLTPSFPAVPGQKVIVQTLANGLAAITNITATVDGRLVTVDSQGRIEITPTTAGRLVVDVTATDADGRVGHNSTVVKVRDQQDSAAPIVAFAPGLDGALVKSVTNIIGSVSDRNLDSWVLEIADFGENVYRTLASGNGAVSDLTLAQFDPGKLENGFYQLRLRATDISDRTSLAQAVVEVNTGTTKNAYTRTETDLSITFSSSLPHSLTPSLNLIRTYSSLNTDEVGSFGNGWQLASLDTNIQTNVPLTGRESLGVYEPFRVGTRLYLTTPTGERVGFTFAPQKHTIPGLTYYTPAWVADSGVSYTLSSADAKLTLAGNRLYDLKTGHAYNPASGEFNGADYTLTAADGTVYHLNSAGGVTQEIATNGTRLIYSDSGITSSTGETVRFVKDTAGRLTQITAPDGSLVIYSYDTEGNLVSARNLASGDSHRYGYSSNLLTLATGTSGTAGEAITYSITPQVSPVLADLGSAAQFTGKTINDSLGESDRFTISLRDSELRSTATGTVLLGVELQGNMTLPTLLGLTPVATHLDASGSYALFAVNRAGLNLISLTNTSPTPSLSLFIAGDVNRDGLVDGVDSGLLEGAIASGVYNTTYDFNRDGVINATDVQILGSNYGFTANRAPVITSTSVLTHSDLSTSVALDKLATDPEGDAIFYRIINPVNGAVTFTPDGHSALFTPTAGYSGMASFDVVASDGFSSSAPAKVTVNVSNAALVNLDFARHGLRLDVGGSTELVVVGDFADQQDVILPYSYLQLASDNSTVAAVSAGKVTGLSDGVSVLSAASHGISAFTVMRVGTLSDPTTQEQLNVATAEDNGLDLYPHAVILPVGVDRRLLVKLNGEANSPQLQAASNGTQYFVSNPNIISVTPDGVITSLNNGVANVTVIYGGAEAVVPVQVEMPHLGATILGSNGGVVEGSDGSMVMLAQGALTHDSTVNITSLTLNDLTLPPPVPDVFSTVGAFRLDVGNDSLNLPAQIAIKAPTGLAAGTEVLFLRQGELPDATGQWNPIWLIQESGKVGTDGMIRTSSPPLTGFVESGVYSVATFSQEELAITAAIEGSATAATVSLIGSTSLYPYLAASLPALGLGLIAVTAAAFPILALYALYLHQSSVTVMGIPRTGLPVVTTAGVELNPQGIPTFNAVLDTPLTVQADPSAPPVLQQAQLSFVNNEPVVSLTGSNFLNNTNSEGSHFEDLIVDFRYGGKTYEGTILSDLSEKLGNNQYKLLVKPPETVVLGESEISLKRRQKERSGLDGSDEKEIVLVTEKEIQIVPTCVEYQLTARRWADTIDVVNLQNPNLVNTSNDLLLAGIPVGTSDRADGPRAIAATSNGTRAYVILETSGRVALADLMTLQQVDTKADTADIDPIDLPTGASPHSVVIDHDNHYAYIADGRLGAIYVLDINPNSVTYNQVIQTIPVNPAPHGLREIAISNDGHKLFVTTPDGAISGNGEILIVNIDPKDRPKNPSQNLRKWNQQIAAVEGDLGLEGISVTSDSSKLVFTNRKNDVHGFGVLTINNDDPLTFNATTNYVALNLGSFNDYFDVNESIAATVTKDGKYAFVVGRNGRLFGGGFESIDGIRAGSNIGIIQDPLTDHAKLVAATRPIPMGLANDLVLSSDDKFLTVSYPGVGLAANTVSSNGVGATFTFDVQQMITTLENPGNYLLDSFDRGIGSSAFNLKTERQATSNDLSYVPIDDINPQIDRVAADFQIIQGDWRYNQFTFGVPDGSIYAPVGRGANPGGLTSASVHQFVNLEKVENAESLTPTFKWNFDGQKDDDGDVCSLPVDPNNVQSVDLYISVFDVIQGLLPDDSWPDLQPSNPSLKDYNPNRILTAHWTKDLTEPLKNLGIWTWNGGSTSGRNDMFDMSKLTDKRKLTAGQTYYWAVKADNEPDPAIAKFHTPLPTFSSNTFSGVTILTRGAELNGDAVDKEFEAMARHIAQLDVNDPNLVKPEDQGVVLKYDTTTGKWKNIITNALINSEGDLHSDLGKPLVLLTGWNFSLEQTKNNSGFSEAAADTFYASLVGLDQTLGGSLGNTKGIYDNTGKLIRTQGKLFNSYLHFIGFGQGAVIDDEIIQRLGTDYPLAGGAKLDAMGNVIRGNLQMTTIDPNDSTQASLKIDLRNRYEPQIKVWNNINFADNYYQAVNVSLKTDTRIGKAIIGADLNVDLSEFTGFSSENGNEDGGPHNRALAWYAGTVDLSDSNLPLLNNEKIYKRLGDLQPNDRENNLSKTWYTPYPEYQLDHSDNQNAPWEGIGIGWFYSVLGGGQDKRLQSNIDRTLLSEDNTNTTSIARGDRMQGDYTIPTLFNGNFDAIVMKGEKQPIPGWSSQNNVTQTSLISLTSDPGNLVLKLSGKAGNTSSITHNPFVVPEWGDLRFDLDVLLDSIDRSGRLSVSLNPINPADGSEISQTILLQQADGTLGAYADDRYKIGYGVGSGNFETFNIDIPERLRGKAATLTFQLQDLSGSEPTIYLDNVFFKSDLFEWGNPTEARADSRSGKYDKNYLIEKPQYSLSYNSQKNTLNWVSWEVNKSWLGNPNSDNSKFIPDPDLNATGWYQVKQNDYAEAKTILPDGNNLERGHMTAAEDRTRSLKDYIATYLTTNILPQHEKNNGGPWKGLEYYLRDQAKANQDFYVIAGGYGTKGDFNSIPVDDNGIKRAINVPSYVWKVVVRRNFGDPIEQATDAFAVFMPNDNIAGVDWTNYRYSIQQLEDKLNGDSNSPQYNFLSGISDSTRRDFLRTRHENLAAPLLADTEFTSSVDTSKSATLISNTSISNTSIWHNGVLEGYSPEFNTVQISSGQVSSIEANAIKNSIAEVSSTQVSSPESSIVEISSGQVSPTEISTAKASFTQDSTTEISTTEIGIAKTTLPQNSTTEIGTNKDGSIKEGLGHINSTQVSPTQVDISHIKLNLGTTQVNSTQVTASQSFVTVTELNTNKISLPSSVTSQQLFNSNTFPVHTLTSASITTINSTAQTLWNTLLQPQTPFDINLQLTSSLAKGQLAEAIITKYDSLGRPIGGIIEVDPTANGIGWFIDPTPFDNSEFTTSLTDTAFRATTGDAYGKYDLLTSILHEMGHLAGIISGYTEFDRHIQTVNGSKLFIGDNFTATLTKDGSHLDSKLYPFDLMNTSLSPGVRKLPSIIDLQILNAVRSLEWGSGGVGEGGNALQAPLNSDPLIGILNGDFDTQADWSTRGAATILNSHAILTEDSPFNSNFTQTIQIPEHAKYLQFTILDTHLGTNEFAPNDAFEVALLDARTLTPLVGTSIGLTQTDSLLNLQQTGNAYFSGQVKIAGANTSGDKIALNTPRTVKIDISNIAPGTLATLYFDLLGFGAKDGKVIIDNVMLLDKDLISPTATDDTATTDQGKPVLINILANDSDADGTINPSTVQIGTAPHTGTIIINSDGTLTYTPNNTFVGIDTFTYIVLDNDNAISNEATVTVNINNIAPIIDRITVESNLIEGTIATFSATATDPGDNLTYTWNFGDDSNPKLGQTLNHTFADNGTYTAILTVTDTYGASTVETLLLNVNNVAPKVSPGADMTTNEGTAITFNGSFIDPGILDTHTIKWDFGDGTTLEYIPPSDTPSLPPSYLNPTHTYTKDGIYTATLTVTDNDSGTNSNSLTVTVNNTDPIINNISGDTNVFEGAVANFSATATDSGLDTLTYTWNFGDDSDPVIGQNVNHIFAQDGNYTVNLTVTDTNGGATSETLSVQVNNAAPIITNISGDTNVDEGAVANFSAIATDPGNDTITYTWNFGDGSDPVIAQNVNHIFADNGIYTVTLTVSDSDGANTSSTLTTNVGNVAPIVSAGVNQTIYKAESVSFDGRFTDPGILDTHTIRWDFGDGNTTTGILNPSHIYTTDGTYTATLTITDNDNAVSNDTMTVTVKKPPSISVSDVTIIEGDNGQKLAIFTASLSEISSRNISVNYTTADGTAYSALDYTATNGTITFKAGETTKTIAVEVIGDTIDEFDETFFLKLDNAINATITTTSGVGTIVDNDSAPTLALSDRTITEGDNSTTVATFTVSLSTASAKPVTVNYTTADGTAISGSDYTSTNGTLTFAPGEISKFISVQVLGDTLDEFDETFFLNLSNATNATIVNTQAVGTIVDNDSAPTLAISDRTITEGDNGTTVATFTVSLSDKSAKPITVKYTTADGTAIAADDYTATNGIISFAPGETSKTISVQVLGDVIDEFDETFNINLSDATNATITKNQAVSTIVDNDAPPSIMIGDRTITETDNGAIALTYTISLDAPSGKPISVKYATADGTATAGNDYTAINGSITFAPGETSKTISVQVIGDTIDEFDETFFLNLSDATNVTFTKNQAVSTIVDNDAPPVLTINDRTITEPDNGTATVTFTVSLSATSAKPIAVNYATLDGTAVAGSDYTANQGTLTFAPLETSKTISVQVIGDTIDEFDESFFLNLANATNATIADAQGAGTILDNDAPPTLSINDKTITEGDLGTQTMVFTVSLSAISQKTISVDYTTANGTATSGSDYTATNGTLTFAPGETTKNISVQVIGDRSIEADETFNMNLSSATNATIADAQGVGTILNNDQPPPFAIIAEGTVTINNGGDFDGETLLLDDDALIYAGIGFTINGNPTLPVQRDAAGNPIRNSSGKLILVDRAIAVAPGYTVTNGPSNQYANLIPPQVVDKLSVNVPVYADVKGVELNRRIPANSPTVTFNASQNPINSASDWTAKFPPAGTASNPTVVKVIGGGLNIPSNVTTSNYVITVEQGDINFNGNGHSFNNVMLVSNNGNINLSTVQARDLSVFASGSINMNAGARFAGSTLMANGTSGGSINFNGATTTTDSASNLKVISTGDITFNAAANTRGTFQAVKNFNYNGNSTLFGSIEVKGNITFNTTATVTNVAS